MTNLPPAAGNVLSVTLNGNTINYTVPANATLATVAAGLANALNVQSNVTQVWLSRSATGLNCNRWRSMCPAAT